MTLFVWNHIYFFISILFLIIAPDWPWSHPCSHYTFFTVAFPLLSQPILVWMLGNVWMTKHSCTHTKCGTTKTPQCTGKKSTATCWLDAVTAALVQFKTTPSSFQYLFTFRACAYGTLLGINSNNLAKYKNIISFRLWLCCTGIKSFEWVYVHNINYYTTQTCIQSQVSMSPAFTVHQLLREISAHSLLDAPLCSSGHLLSAAKHVQ